ncbi:hypothetical protein A5647_19740 [Mycobacterium sp. 1100029.7]|nr:hypothetical protein A5647_19740 [Mycobacterium sp. 1100029.7]
MNAAASAKRLSGAIAAVAAIALSLGGAAPIAYADATGDFLVQVRGDGIGTNSPDSALIEDAKAVCAMLDYQESAYQYLNQHSGLDRNQAALFVSASSKYFCPQYAPR